MKENKSGVVDMTVSPSVKVQIHSFYWVGKDQLCIITNKSIELLQLFPANQKTKVLAKHDISVRFYFFNVIFKDEFFLMRLNF